MKCDKIDCVHCEELSDAQNQRIKNRSQKLRDSLVTRLNRVEGQVRGIKGMIEKDAYCDDILNQISAAQAALNSISKLVLESHMKSCLIERIQSGETEVVDELLNTIKKMLK